MCPAQGATAETFFRVLMWEGEKRKLFLFFFLFSCGTGCESKEMVMMLCTTFPASPSLAGLWLSLLFWGGGEEKRENQIFPRSFSFRASRLCPFTRRSPFILLDGRRRRCYRLNADWFSHAQKERERNKSADVLRGGNKKIKKETVLLDYSTPYWTNNRPSVRPPTQQQEQSSRTSHVSVGFFFKNIFID